MQNMVSFILLIPLIVPSSTQTRTATLETLAQQLDQLRVEALQIRNGIEGIEDFEGIDTDSDTGLLTAQIIELLAAVGATQNATTQLLSELDTLKGRQAASAAIQLAQALMFVAYLLTTISIYVVKRCKKVREKSQRKEFELLEKKLLSNKAKRRAAAAREKSAPAPSQK